MSNLFTIKDQYNYKKKSCVKRCIDFNFTLKEFEALWNLRGEVGCFYTDKPMSITKSGKSVPDDYASLERLNSDLPYDRTNCVWCKSEVNRIKCTYLEQEQPLPKNNRLVAGIVARIKKVLNNPKAFERKFQVYKDAYAKLDEKQTTLAQKNIEALEEQRLKDAQIAKEAALEKTYKDECMFASHYVKLAQEFSQGGVLMQITLGELKKKFNTKACSVTSIKFNSVEEKFIFVKDLTKPITKDNISVVTYEAREALYKLIKGSDLKSVSLNLHKLQNKLGE